MTSPANGSTDHSEASAGTTSRWPCTSSAPRCGSAPSMRATTLVRPGADSTIVGVEPDLGELRRRRTRRRPARPCEVSRSPVLVVSMRSRSRQMSTTSSVASCVFLSRLAIRRRWITDVVGHLAGPDRRGHPILRRCERAGPPVVVRATGVVGVVEVERDPVVALDDQAAAERALDRVGDVAPAAVGVLRAELRGRAARAVAQRQEQAAAVRVEPPQRQRAPRRVERCPPGGSGSRRPGRRCRCRCPRRRRPRRDRHGDAGVRVLREVAQAGERRARPRRAIADCGWVANSSSRLRRNVGQVGVGQVHPGDAFPIVGEIQEVHPPHPSVASVGGTGSQVMALPMQNGRRRRRYG